MGAKTTYTQTVADAICERLSEGEPLRVICRDKGYPSWRTAYRWMDEVADFASRIAHARVLGFDAIAEQCVEIADDGSRDYSESTTDPDTGETKGDERFQAEHVQRAKLRVETRLKLLAKWDPKRYGDKVDVNHAGSLKVSLDSTDGGLL